MAVQVLVLLPIPLHWPRGVTSRDHLSFSFRVAAPAWPLLRRSRSCVAGLLAAHGLHIRLLERRHPSFLLRTSDDLLETPQKLSCQSLLICPCWVSLAIGVVDLLHEVRDLLKPNGVQGQKFLYFCKNKFLDELQAYDAKSRRFRRELR